MTMFSPPFGTLDDGTRVSKHKCLQNEELGSLLDRRWNVIVLVMSLFHHWKSFLGILVMLTDLSIFGFRGGLHSMTLYQLVIDFSYKNMGKNFCLVLAL